MFTFACSACGKCCHGWLPLTLSESVAFAGTSPLALVWNLHRRATPQTPHYRAARKLFGTVALPGGTEAAPWVRPVVLVPPETPCRHLADGMCAIHECKPLRCRTMPFHANLPADDQERHLKPKADWPCFNPPEGEAIYDRGRFLSTSYKASFQAEARALAADASLIRRHIAETVQAGGPGFLRLLAQVAATPGGYLVIPWVRIVPHLLADGDDRTTLESALTAQAAVLADWHARPVSDAYLGHYRTLAEDLAAVRAAWTSDHVAA